MGSRTAWETSGGFSTSMVRVRRPANEPCQKLHNCLLPSVDWMRCVLLATRVASGGKSCGPVRRFYTRIRDLWLGTFGNPGNGEYRKELRRAVAMVQSYLRGRQFPEERALLRLDGLYGTGAVLADLGALPFVMRGIRVWAPGSASRAGAFALAC